MPGGIVTYYILSILLALIPAVLWLSTIFKNTKRKNIQVLLFLLSTSTVIPIFIYQCITDKSELANGNCFANVYEATLGNLSRFLTDTFHTGTQYFDNIRNFLYETLPKLNVEYYYDPTLKNQTIYYIMLFISVGITEEIAKQLIIRIVDKKFLLIETMSDSIRFSLIAALGFSFLENILYIFAIWTNLGVQQLFVTYAFRSIFTTCAHMIFSGFFGYYYGIGKFSLKIREQSKWQGNKMWLTKIISKITGMPQAQALKEQMILKGLFIAIVLHAIYDFLLQLNQILMVVPFVILGYLALRHLLKRKAGNLILVTDIDNQQQSTMVRTDEEVVIELIGMWFKEKNYVDVIHICERLLKRDPDNKIVQLFKAKALDKIDEKDSYYKILTKIFPTKKEKEDKSIAKLIKEKNKSVVENKAATKNTYQ